MSYINRINDGNGTHLIEPTLFAVAGGTSAAYTATIDNFTLVDGVVINIAFSNTNSASATLNINSSGAKGLYYAGAAIAANLLTADHTYNLVYDSTNNRWNIIGDLNIEAKVEIVDMIE